MISFKILPEKEDVKEYLYSVKGCFSRESYFDEIEELLLSYLDMEGDDGHAEVAVTINSGCFLIRICQYDYAFLCPIPISDDASISGATEEIRKYAIKEELPLTFIDVYENDLNEISEPFRFVEVYPMDDSGEVFAVVPKTEASQFGALPIVEGKKIIFNAIGEGDIADYAHLCRSDKVNRLYGNDYRDDYGDAPDTALFGRMEFEVMSGISSTFAIRHEGKFAGEAVIFGFDYVGGAKVAIRLLPEFWGLGIGSEALELLLFVAEKFDLKRVSTAVKKENVPSIKMTGKFMDYKREEDDTVIFEKTF